MPAGKLYKYTKSDKIIVTSKKKKVPKTTKKYVAKKISSMKEMNYIYSASSVQPELVNLQKVLLNGCAQGDAIGTRTGNAITMRGLDIRFTLNYQYVDATHIYGAYDDLIGIWIVCDTQANGSAPADADFGADGVTCNATMRIDWDNRKRFKQLYHAVINYKGPTQGTGFIASANNQGIKSWKVSVPLKNIKAYYSGNAGTIADITRNSIYLIVAGYNTYNAGLYYPPVLSYTRRLYFKE